ncbi:hypothetical protein QQ045_004967 [Rhodiola kirilowii]
MDSSLQAISTAWLDAAAEMGLGFSFLLCDCSNCSSSSSENGVLLIFGSSWLNHLSLQLLPTQTWKIFSNQVPVLRTKLINKLFELSILSWSPMSSRTNLVNSLISSIVGYLNLICFFDLRCLSKL